MSSNARQYAEKTFVLAAIAENFERVVRHAAIRGYIRRARLKGNANRRSCDDKWLFVIQSALTSGCRAPLCSSERQR